MARKQPWILGPLVPLSFMVAYQADLAYGNKMERVLGQPLLHYVHILLATAAAVCVCLYTAEADSMLVKEGAMLAMPGGPLTVDYIDELRKKSR